MSSLGKSQRAAGQTQGLRSIGATQRKGKRSGRRTQGYGVAAGKVDHRIIVWPGDLGRGPIAGGVPVAACRVVPCDNVTGVYGDGDGCGLAILVSVRDTVGECRSAREGRVWRGVGERSVIVVHHRAGAGHRLGEVEHGEKVGFGIGIVGQHIACSDCKSLRSLCTICDRTWGEVRRDPLVGNGDFREMEIPIAGLSPRPPGR